MLVRRHWIPACCLALTTAAAVGGWFFGRNQFTDKISLGEPTRVLLPRLRETVATVHSPKFQWTMRVKTATSTDYPRLLEEWKTIFPDKMDGIEYQQETSLRWLLAEWFLHDRKGFVKAVTDKDFKSPHQAALVIARLNPDMIVTLRQFKTEMSGDGSQQSEIGDDLIRSICDSYSIESCLSTAKLWAADLNGERDDKIFEILAAHSAAIDPDKTEAALESLPKVARAAFAAEIVKRLPPEDAGRRIALLDQLTPKQWDRDLGESLGNHGADYADAIFKLPASITSEAQPFFMNAWVENDPDAAIQWFSNMPEKEGFGPAAVGLFEGWACFDSPAALAWAESLTSGPFRQAVAPSVACVLAENNPREAWRWAASITNPDTRAEAYDAIHSAHRDGAPAEFDKEREAATRAAGLK